MQLKEQTIDKVMLAHIMKSLITDFMLMKTAVVTAAFALSPSGFHGHHTYRTPFLLPDGQLWSGEKDYLGRQQVWPLDRQSLIVICKYFPELNGEERDSI